MNKIVFLFSLTYLLMASNISADNIEKLVISCDDGNVVDCRKLAVAYMEQDDLLEDLTNIETIQKLYHKACDAGDKEACLHLRILYFDNIKVENSNKILLKFRKLPKLIQLSTVVHNIAYQYANSSPIVSIDYKKAFKLFEWVCKNDIVVDNYGRSRGCYNLGTMYDTGHGVRKNHHKALELYIKGCKLGYKQSWSLTRNIEGLNEHNCTHLTPQRKPTLK